MEGKFDISVVLPVIDVTGDNFKEYFDNAVKSVAEQKVKPEALVIVCANDDVAKFMDEYDFSALGGITVNKVKNETKDTDFCSQVNLGIESSTTEWVTILEHDDQFSKIWVDNVSKYSESHSDVSVFLPLVVDVNIEGTFVHFSNEPVWAKDFSDEIGYLDNGALLKFPNFQVSGLAVKKETIEECGGFKKSVTLYFGYEFLLRMTYFSKPVMTIPKVGYRKTNMRPGSLFYNYFNGDNETRINPVEARFWFETAKKECYFTKDREIRYEEAEAAQQQ